MTKEEAIQVLSMVEAHGTLVIQAKEMAIEALKQEHCEDAIRRQAVIDITWEEPSYTDAMNVLTEVRDKVKELPSVNPQKPNINEVLAKIRAEIADARFIDKDTKHCRNANATGLEVALDIIDKYKAEGSGE